MKRSKCLKPNELAYLMLISSVVTGCTQKVDRLPEYSKTYEYCKENPDYCNEYKKVNEQLSSNGNPQYNTQHEGSLFNYYLLYHMFFSNSNRSSYYRPYYNQRFNNSGKREEEYSTYRGHGVYSPAYVSRISRSISEGRTSFSSSSGTVFKSSQFAGSSKSSTTGRSISRGGFGSIGGHMSGGHVGG